MPMIAPVHHIEAPQTSCHHEVNARSVIPLIVSLSTIVIIFPISSIRTVFFADSIYPAIPRKPNVVNIESIVIEIIISTKVNHLCINK